MKNDIGDITTNPTDMKRIKRIKQMKGIKGTTLKLQNGSKFVTGMEV